MSGEDYILRGARYLVLHELFEELLIVLPAFHRVGCCEDVHALKHVHEECNAVHNDRVNAGHIFSFVECLEDYFWISDFYLFEFGRKWKFLSRLTVQINYTFRIGDVTERG